MFIIYERNEWRDGAPVALYQGMKRYVITHHPLNKRHDTIIFLIVNATRDTRPSLVQSLSNNINFTPKIGINTLLQGRVKLIDFGTK